MNTTLYIIGNGFDRHHGIRSAYGDFAEFLKSTNPEFFRLVEEYFAADYEFWGSFEERLADFDVHTLIDYASNFLPNYGADDWSDSGHHDYQFAIEQVVTRLTSELKSHFANWIRQLKMPDPSTIPSQILRLNTGATFLNFNYTPSLTKLYDVPSSNVCHIHGSAADAYDQFILGHGWNPKDRGSSNDGLDLEETDTRVADGNRIIDEYFERTFKPTDRVIAAHQSFFEALRGTQQILVMGHSLSDVDLPYFEEINRHINDPDLRWRVSYHQDDKPRLHRQLEKLTFAPRVELLQLVDMI